MTDPSSLWTLVAVALSFAGVTSFWPASRGRRVEATRDRDKPLRRRHAVPVIPIIQYDDSDGGLDERAAAPGVLLRDVSFDDDAESDEPTGVTSAYRLEAAGRTHRGLRRRDNEDSLLMLEDHHVFVVADGMGGHAGGGVASDLAIDAIAKTVTSKRSAASHGGRVPREAAALIDAVGAANDAIRRSADANDRFGDMGTTIVAARFSPRKRRLYVTHVGDSRCYRLRNGRLRQLTLDHTMSALGITGPAAHHLSRAVGTRDRVEPDVAVLKPELGDAYILCSDGLTKMVTDEAIAAVLAGAPDVEQAVDGLVRAANERGGKDNVTAIVVRVKAKAA